MSRKAYLLLVIATMATCMVTVFFAGKLPARVVVNIHQTIGMNLLHSSDQSIDMDDHRLDRDIDIDSRHSDQDIDMDDHRLDQDIDMDDYRSDQDIDMDDYRSDQDIDIYMDPNYSYTDHRHRISLESTMPFPKETKPAEEILRQNWTNQIQDFLRNCSRSSPVTVVAANYPYRDVVINWLIAARVKVEPPLENILVVSFDSPLQELLQRVGIESVQVPPESVLINSAYVNAYDKLLVARVIVLRLINYWGYDVAHYDTDAIILKNPLSLYNKHADSDVVGSTGTWPFELGKKWGFTLCMGVILFRSTPQTDILWQIVNERDEEVTLIEPKFYAHDDQVRLNYALDAVNITWDGKSTATTECLGGGANGVKVTAMSHLQVCRLNTCKVENADRYYIWHKGGVKSRDSKIETSSEIGSWYLKKDWESITRETTAKGVEWLRKISV